MAINFKKSCCLRIGPRCDTHCMNLRSMTGSILPWIDTIRYLGIHFVTAKYSKCSLDYTKHSFHRAANSIFGKIGRIASEESIHQLVKGKCLPILRSLFAIAHPSVCRMSVCLSVLCNVRMPYSGGWNFLQYFYGVRYPGYPLTSAENFTEIVPGEPLRRGS